MIALSINLSENVSAASNPLDIVEQIAETNEWPCYRQSEEELATEVKGQWCDYKLWFAWHAELGVLHLSCTMDMTVKKSLEPATHTLLALANEQLWLGHFEVWSDEGFIVFRHASLFREHIPATTDLVEDLIEIAVNEAERFYPAFQFVLLGGKTPQEALQAAMLETAGEA